MCDAPLYNSAYFYFKNALRNVSKILKHTISTKSYIYRILSV